MDFMQKIAILWFLFISSSIAVGQESPPRPYYSSQSITTMESIGARKHAPMAIFIDEQNEEPAETESAALSRVFAYSIQGELFPIIISANLLKNVLTRINFLGKKIPVNETIKGVIGQSFNTANWNLFDVPQSQFVVLTPKKFVELYGKNLGLKELPALNNLLPTRELASDPVVYNPLIEWLDKNKKMIPFNPKDFEQIFVNKSVSDTNSTPLWDIFIIGHGSPEPKPLIANLKPDEFNKVLSFFDNKITAGMVYVVSCYAGGKNRTLLETTKEGIQINHNFTLILGSPTNSAVALRAPLFYNTLQSFFNNAAFVEDKGESVNRLLTGLIFFNPIEESTHGTGALPQIWFPGGYGFQTVNSPNLVLSFGNVQLKKHQENHTPLIIENKIVVLIYPPNITIPLIVNPINAGTILPKVWNNLTFVFEPKFFIDTDIQTQKIIINELKKEGVLPDYLSQLPEISAAQSPDNPNNVVYPEFLSMIPGDSFHAFSQIKVVTTKSRIRGPEVAQGILQFLRESFMDVYSKFKNHTFFIDSVTGKNDISLTLAASRLLSNTKEKHPLEELLKDLINKDITLKNVIIQAPNDVIIAFQLEDSAWMLTDKDFPKDPKKEMRWNFKKWNKAEYENFYNTSKKKLVTAPTGEASQKSIGQALVAGRIKKQREQKQAELIMLQKALELKQREAAIATTPVQEEPKK